MASVFQIFARNCSFAKEKKKERPVPAMMNVILTWLADPMWLGLSTLPASFSSRQEKNVLKTLNVRRETSVGTDPLKT
eukprot:CAMPEP_0170545402 /NCGR_PEP_ID=MMETSP0211-20121228/3803_1 /TAXON_ID=311385 /ORGANISM="Pseudokeronopsis sp., Strain OXSARD2" /LENGTH=77 /DNA_ID=CAMNT_0010849295 /DNA_START=248 /DNA_END=481 /DNA_ORIENTATION=-